MKQIDDTKTLELIPVELLPPVKRPRGRPATGHAMSAAERQKARRDRIRATGGDFLTVAVDAELKAALDRYLFGKDITKDEAVSRILRDRLLRKR